jgi:hypothetical protein
MLLASALWIALPPIFFLFFLARDRTKHQLDFVFGMFCCLIITEVLRPKRWGRKSRVQVAGSDMYTSGGGVGLVSEPVGSGQQQQQQHMATGPFAAQHPARMLGSLG